MNRGPRGLADVGDAVIRLIDLPLWSFVGGNGSRISLDFGKRILRPHPLTNEKLTEEQRRYEAERFLFVECPWTLTRRGQVVCSWADDYEFVDESFAPLIGSTVRDAGVDGTTGRLEITFANDAQLSVVNDQVEVGLDGYSVFTSDEVLIIDAAGQVTSESRV